ncbi:hypothetical protein F511_28852 [Dorcoceras hygrometricum]|uniref:Retrotransposon gag domain-containing protein n=1 Tax=Dorcoceras hygrometricum TaxID=472368 RepID=A0A2Z7BPD0_9LAMI|nr:hypothetical protein F511_28852 [Dorcoceras hygrometricum]
MIQVTRTATFQRRILRITKMRAIVAHISPPLERQYPRVAFSIMVLKQSTRLGAHSELCLLTKSPLTNDILSETLPKGVNLTNLPDFDGTSDPQEHIDKFYVKADLYSMSDAAYCKIFRTTLSGRALTWFNKLPSGTIASLEQLTQRFLQQFSINKKYPKTAYLFNIVQKEGESLRE